uniref:Uncharacterized protein n=1 Tax=Peronospora matthiolae TaxID=2874970 RepID=A0AAV1V929_9STRA
MRRALEALRVRQRALEQMPARGVPALQQFAAARGGVLALGCASGRVLAVRDVPSTQWKRE